MGQHEIELRAYLGVWVYLTAQILLVLLVYHTLSVVAATTGKYEAQAHAAAPACLGLGLVVYGLFFFFYLLTTFFSFFLLHLRLVLLILLIT